MLMDFVPTKRGSLEMYLLKLVQSLAKQEADVCFLFSGECPEWFRAELMTGTIVLCSKGPPLGRGNYFSTMRTVLRLRPSVIVFWFASMFSWRTLLLTRMPFVERSIFSDHTSAAGSIKTGLRAVVAKWRGRLASSWYYKIVSVSEYNRRRNIERNYIVPEKTQVVHNGIDVSQFTGASDTFVLPGPYFFFAGQLIHEKGVVTLLNAYARLKQAGTAGNVRLILAGDGPERENLHNLAKTLGIDKETLFLGLRDDVFWLMAHAVATIVPSEWPEAFGYTALEAMAAGCPLITSDAGALPEVVGDCGLQFHAGNVNELAARMRYVLCHVNTDDMSERIQRARDRARNEFSEERRMTEHVKLYLCGLGS